MELAEYCDDSDTDEAEALVILNDENESPGARVSAFVDLCELRRACD